MIYGVQSLSIMKEAAGIKLAAGRWYQCIKEVSITVMGYLNMGVKKEKGGFMQLSLGLLLATRLGKFIVVPDVWEISGSDCMQEREKCAKVDTT
jgi:hypothetical protein